MVWGLRLRARMRGFGLGVQVSGSIKLGVDPSPKVFGVSVWILGIFWATI